MTLSGSARRGLRVQRHVDYVAYEQSDGGVRQRAQRRAGSRVGASGFEGTLVRGWRREVNRAGADCAPKSRDRLWLDRLILMLLMSAVYPGNGSLPFRKRGWEGVLKPAAVPASSWTGRKGVYGRHEGMSAPFAART